MSKKRALILCHYFSPSNMVAAHRPWSWVRYFPEMGMETDVICINTEEADEEEVLPDGSKVTRVSEYHNPLRRLFKRIPLINVLADVFFNFFVNQGEYRNIYAAAKKALRAEEYDVIIATGAPFVLFKYAGKLSRLVGIPWVGDYRDGWSTNGEYLIGGTKQFVLRPVYAFVEKRTMKSAVLLTSAAANYSKSIQALHPQKEVKTIWNGFFEEDFQAIEDFGTKSDELSIAYLGTLYHFQPVEIFVQGLLSYCRATGRRIAVHFLGLGSQIVQKKRVEDLFAPHKEHLNLHVSPKINRPEALRVAAKMQLLLLLCDDVITQLPAKTFDYMALQKPILVVKDDKNIVNGLLNENPMAHFLNSAEDVSSALSKLQENSDSYTFSPGKLKSLTYNRRIQATNLYKEIEKRISP